MIGLWFFQFFFSGYFLDIGIKSCHNKIAGNEVKSRLEKMEFYAEAAITITL